MFVELYTLDFLISVGLLLLFFGIFSRVYGLIREPTLIDFLQIFVSEIFKAMKREKLGYRHSNKQKIRVFNFTAWIEFFWVYCYSKDPG